MRDTSSSSRWVINGDDPADSDFEIEEDIGSKKKRPHKSRSKRASNIVPNPLPPTSEDKDEEDDDDEEEEEGEEGDQEEQTDDNGDEEEESEGEDLGGGDTESDDEDGEYNPRMLVSPIDVSGPPARRKNWKENQFKDFHTACNIK